ncbi:hypothetical protein F4556_000408 [Kitasatospora gansuensis]|uniref:Ig-like domain-containing protein n=1 Tax=Kitasatospora gansuensis TaxID=258050 RepID=A0A7W7S7T4_9ACTN|nr:hypothetical protein [Kitasatospora gansuensis]MBB4944873.1 hypothetical protein [Kitasatospora gansuensis]
MRKRLLGVGLAVAGLTALLAGPAHADDTFGVSVTGSPSGVEAHCPEGSHLVDWTVTAGDGSPLGPDQRVRWTSLDEEGVAAWIAPYAGSPAPPESITLTLSCSC